MVLLRLPFRTERRSECGRKALGSCPEQWEILEGKPCPLSMKNQWRLVQKKCLFMNLADFSESISDFVLYFPHTWNFCECLIKSE